MDKMIDNIDKYVDETQPVQCKIGLKWMIEKYRTLNPKVYLEIGAAHLATFRLFEQYLPKEDGLAIGIDTHPNTIQWNLYKTEDRCRTELIHKSSIEPDVFEQVKTILNGRKIDWLTIDGWHWYDHVRPEWDYYTPLVRPGGIVMLHDCDPPAVQRGFLDGQGAGMVYLEELAKGQKGYLVPNSTIGTAIFEM